MKLSKITNEQIKPYIESGLIRMAQHPSLPLRIYNYSQKCQFDGKWDDITIACRGLILDEKNNVVFQPPKKFFNRGEKFAAEIDMKQISINQQNLDPLAPFASEKLDGYAIWLCNSEEYGLIIASRGSFESSFAHSARELLGESIKTNIDNLPHGKMWYLELLLTRDQQIECPLVVKYDENALVNWGYLENIGDGNFKEYAKGDEDVFKNCVPIIPDVEEYLAKSNVEGVVVNQFDPDADCYLRVKVKGAEYLMLHKLMVDITPKVILENLKNGIDPKSELPEELVDDYREIEDDLKSKFAEKLSQVESVIAKYKELEDKEVGLSKEIDQHDKPFIFTSRKNPEMLADHIWRVIKLNLKPQAEE